MVQSRRADLVVQCSTSFEAADRSSSCWKLLTRVCKVSISKVNEPGLHCGSSCPLILHLIPFDSMPLRVKVKPWQKTTHRIGFDPTTSSEVYESQDYDLWDFLGDRIYVALMDMSGSTGIA